MVSSTCVHAATLLGCRYGVDLDGLIKCGLPWRMFGCQVDFAFVHGHKSYVSGHDLWTPMLYDASGLGDVCGMYIDLD